MGCGNEPNERDDQMLEESARGENCNLDPKIEEEWRSSQTQEAKQELFKEIDKISEGIKQFGEKAIIPPENLKEWAEYLDIMNRNLERVVEELPLRFELMPEIKDFERSRVIDNKDVQYYLSELSANALKTDRSAIAYRDELKISPNGDIIRGEIYLFKPEEPIRIYQQPPPESLKGTPPQIRERTTEEALVHTIYHEQSHDITKNLPSEKLEKWEKLHKTTLERGCEFVTRYARINYLEDFAECFWVYKEHPEWLFKQDIEKFKFFNEIAKNNYI
ncbi:MAG: hypothetical protein DRI61_05930 [Chloroflexi bacterium]|nr:MAG: hypothetical protein DRI61_05930 [Chloroflexota bacterium]